ncbi:MAG TPA: alpha/beta hydrolase, partial [Polyangiaceae bacterium]|nr:alpha/beta hydrolase [Polyangiaceae bacterium]
AARAPAGLARLVLADAVGARPRRSLPRVLAARLRDALDPAEWGLNVRAAPHVVGNLWRHPRSWLHQVRAGALADVLGEAGAVRVPVLLAWGRRDHTMPLVCARRFAAALPSASIVVGPGSHDWLVTHPEAFARAVRSFQASTAAPGSGGG